MNELQKQLEDRALTAETATWFDKRLTGTTYNLVEAEHVMDWIEATQPAKLAKLMGISLGGYNQLEKGGAR